MTAWTAEDEKLLVVLIKRKANLRATLEACVERNVKNWFCRDTDVESVTSHLIIYATSIRKVLEPFDSEHPGYLGETP